MLRDLLHRLRKSQRGALLIEAIIAVAITGSVLVTVVSVLGTSVRGASRADESTILARLVRSQIELIQQSPFQSDPSNYPSVSNPPEGFSVSFTATDQGRSYAYPDGITVTEVIQKIDVTASGDTADMTMTFFKIEIP